jgi:hypothetical protein
MVAGALWNVTDHRGWILMAVFIGGRIAGNLLLRVLRKGAAARGIMPPISVVSIAIVVSAQALYQGVAVPWIVTAVLGGAIVSEILGRRGEAAT